MSNPNRHRQWGVILHSMTKHHTNPEGCKDLIGMWGENNGANNVPYTLYYTKQEAEAAATKRAKDNNHWNYAAKKYNPRQMSK